MIAILGSNNNKDSTFNPFGTVSRGGHGFILIFTLTWRNDPIWLIVFKWAVQPPSRICLPSPLE